MPQSELNEIWNRIQDGSYKKKASELGWERCIYPEIQHSDELEDMMSIPNKDGTKRDLYARKKNAEEWRKLP